MGRWREAPLAGALHVGPLLVDIEAQRIGATLGGFYYRAADDHEAKAWNALDAFVGG
ncbi:hypothetical protein D3C71_2152360 [compost metagenome]